MPIFPKMASSNFPEWQPPPLHQNFDGLPDPNLGGIIFDLVLNQNDSNNELKVKTHNSQN